MGEPLLKVFTVRHQDLIALNWLMAVLNNCYLWSPLRLPLPEVPPRCTPLPVFPKPNPHIIEYRTVELGTNRSFSLECLQWWAVVASWGGIAIKYMRCTKRRKCENGEYETLTHTKAMAE